MDVRSATNRDKAKIVSLVKVVLNEFGFDYAPKTSEADLQDLEEYYSENSGVFLIMENDKQELIATGALKNMGSQTFKIRKMYVRKVDRKKGYGKEILNNLLQIAQEKGASRVVLETSSTMISAIYLYQSFGFEIKGQKPVLPRCDITMSKKLSPIKIKKS